MHSDRDKMGKTNRVWVLDLTSKPKHTGKLYIVLKQLLHPNAVL